MLKLRRLKVERYRNVRPCELHFNDGVNVLLGQNGSGKTTLLRLITSLYSDPITAIAKEEDFALEVDFAFSQGLARFRIEATSNWALRIAQAVIAMSTEPSANRQHLETERPRKIDISLELDIDKDIWLKANTTDDVLSWKWSHSGGSEAAQSLYFAGSLRDVLSAFTLVGQFANENQGRPAYDRFSKELSETTAPPRFDESLELFESIAGSQISAEVSSSPVPSALLFLGYSRAQLSLGRAFWRTFEKTLRDDLDAAAITVTQSHLPFLDRFIKLVGLKSAWLRVERTEKNVRSAGTGSAQIRFSELKFSFTRQDGSIFPQEHLSYGQKRLLTFLCYLDSVPQVVIADELVNGMHYEWIERCVEALGERQAFLSSQNPLLLDCLSFESQEQVLWSFLLCARSEVEGREELGWRNLSGDEADAFYRSYQAGVQHVGEILRAKALW